MLQLLLGRGRWNYRDIAAEQECAERTVHRDREVLQLAGIPIEFDKEEGCFRFYQEFRFPVLTLTEDEVLGQATATVMGKGPGLDISLGAQPVSQKLAASSREETSHLLADAQELVAVLDLKLADHSRHREIIRTVQWSLVKRKQLSGTYVSPYEPGEVRLHLHPYRLCLVKQA